MAAASQQTCQQQEASCGTLYRNQSLDLVLGVSFLFLSFFLSISILSSFLSFLLSFPSICLSFNLSFLSLFSTPQNSLLVWGPILSEGPGNFGDGAYSAEHFGLNDYLQYLILPAVF